MSLVLTSNKILEHSAIFAELQKACRYLFKNSILAQEARNYINSRISPENQELFEFGYFPDDQNLNVLLDLISIDKLKLLQIVYPFHVQNGDFRCWTDKATLSQHNVIIPFHDMYGNIIALVGRSLLPDNVRRMEKISKYKYTKFDKSFHLFGLSRAKQEIINKKSVIVVEGQIDCISCHESGKHNVVALSGASLGKYQLRLLSRFAKKMYLLLDNDVEGKKSQTKILNKYSKDIEIEVVNLPDGYKDIDHYLRSGRDISSIM